eukprot:Rhum_TRINITY_DN14479_c12_g1::Rhum_TRINITY_DN14479_c12_g1_i3::g.91957::m.91957
MQDDRQRRRHVPGRTLAVERHSQHRNRRRHRRRRRHACHDRERTDERACVAQQVARKPDPFDIGRRVRGGRRRVVSAASVVPSAVPPAVRRRRWQQQRRGVRRHRRVVARVRRRSIVHLRRRRRCCLRRRRRHRYCRGDRRRRRLGHRRRGCLRAAVDASAEAPRVDGVGAVLEAACLCPRVEVEQTGHRKAPGGEEAGVSLCDDTHVLWRRPQRVRYRPVGHAARVRVSQRDGGLEEVGAWSRRCGVGGKRRCATEHLCTGAGGRWRRRQRRSISSRGGCCGGCRRRRRRRHRPAGSPWTGGPPDRTSSTHGRHRRSRRRP